RRSVRPRQLEDVREHVELAVLVAEDVAAITLGVVIVDKDHGLTTRLVAPCLAEVVEPGQLAAAENPAEVAAVAELQQVAGAPVLRRLDRLPPPHPPPPPPRR